MLTFWLTHLSAFQDMSQFSSETGNLGEVSVITSSQAERSFSGASLSGSSAVASKSQSVTSEIGSDNAYETSDMGTSSQGMVHVSETGPKTFASIHDLSASVGEISNVVLLGESILDQPDEFLRTDLQHRKENLAIRRDTFYGNPLKEIPLPRERIEFMSEQDHDKLSGHSRKLSSDSIGSDVSSLRGSELSIPGVSNSVWDGSVDLNGGEARSAIEALCSMEAQFLNDAQVLLPFDQGHKLNRVLVTMQRRLVTAKTDMEDIIARLNQEMTVKEYLTTKVHLFLLYCLSSANHIIFLTDLLNAICSLGCKLQLTYQTYPLFL